MALIKCSECGKEISDKASACPHCGCPVMVDSKKQEYENLYASAKSFSKGSSNTKDIKNGYSSTGRLIVGIIFIVLSAMVLFQSCAAGMVNALEGGNGSDGLIGTFTGLLMIIIGIISIVTRKTGNPKIPMALALILLIYGFLIGYVYNGIFKDLKYYGWLMVICSFVLSARYRRLKKNK